MFSAPIERLRGSPLAARAVPLLVVIVLTILQGQLGAGSQYWLYLAKTIIGAALLWLVAPAVGEMRWAVSWQALAAGVLVFVLWVGLDPWYPKPGSSSAAWNPGEQFGERSFLAIFFIAVRFFGSVVVIPPMEEVFYRSLLYRYLMKPEFASVSLRTFRWIPFLATALIFGFAHREWLAGILCAAIYQGLVCVRGRLGDAITAHAITNLLLGAWVLWKGAWHFW